MRLTVLLGALAALAATTPALAAKKMVQTIPTPVETPAPMPENILVLELSNGGRVRVQLRPDKAPQSVARIKALARAGFYNGLTFHRVIEGFMAQGGDPKGDGSGGSDLPDLKGEFNDLPHVRGVMSMARAQSPDSANSQFFIMFFPRFGLDKNYTVVGRVIEGMPAVDAIERGEPPANPTKIVRASIEGPDTAPPPAPEAASPAPAPAASAPAAAPAAAPAPSAEAPSPAADAPADQAPSEPVAAANAPAADAASGADALSGADAPQ